jgi:hypothetical protein
VWVPPVGPSCVHEARSVGRVPRSAQHAGVGGIERCATIGERQDMVERQVPRWMRRMLGTIARADVAVLADVAGDHPLGQAGPSRVGMDVMVGTDARQARMLAAASSRSARDDTADRAELHCSLGPTVSPLTLVTLDCTPVDIAMSVNGGVCGVYSLGVLRLRSQSGALWEASTERRLAVRRVAAARRSRTLPRATRDRTPRRLRSRL